MEKRGEIKSDGKRGGEAKREGIEKAKKINKERERQGKGEKWQTDRERRENTK